MHGKIFFGIILLLIGILFLANNMGWVENAWNWWPVIIIIAAVFVFISAAKTKHKPWYHTEEGWDKFGKKMEDKFSDEKSAYAKASADKKQKKLEKEFGDDKEA